VETGELGEIRREGRDAKGVSKWKKCIKALLSSGLCYVEQVEFYEQEQNQHHPSPGLPLIDTPKPR
jgi:hypothetical protein